MINRRIHRALVELTPPLLLRKTERLYWRMRSAALRRRFASSRWLHLGCGGQVLEGWLNVDAVPATPAVVRWDLSAPMPVVASTLDGVYSEHFIEHLSRAAGQDLLVEAARCLRSGGRIRISTPDLRYLVSVFLAACLSEWADVGWQPDSPARLLNEGMREWGHKFLYDFDELGVALEAAGFVDVRRVAWGHSEIAKFQNLECRPFHGDLIVEAVKR